MFAEQHEILNNRYAMALELPKLLSIKDLSGWLQSHLHCLLYFVKGVELRIHTHVLLCVKYTISFMGVLFCHVEAVTASYKKGTKRSYSHRMYVN